MISVILPVYNAEKYLKKSISSILNQSFKDFELIICNDCSTDKSEKIIQEFKDSRIILKTNNPNLGYLKTINKLLKNCSYDLIAFQDADDISHPKRFELQIKHLNKNRLDLIGTNYALVSPSGKIINTILTKTNNLILKNLIKDTNPFLKPSIMFKKDIYKRIGGFREEFLDFKNISEDYDWLLRASIFYQFGNINYKEPLYYYRSNPEAMSKNFNNIDQLFGHQVCQFLYRQRLEYGVDDLDLKNFRNIYDYINKLRIPYLEDPSKFYIERAESLMYFGLYWEAISHAFMGFRKRPNVKNLRVLQYCLRKSIFKI